MNCPRCTMLLGLLAASIISHQPGPATCTAFTAGMRSVCVQGLQLHYTRNVSEAEAERVATWLVREGLPAEFPGPMLFEHTEASARLDITAEESAPEDSAVTCRVRRLAAGLSEGVLKGAGVDVCFRSSSGRVLSVTRPIESGPFFYN